ncbi:hypothetical protein IU501_05955 [Nocardia otitidiscaviarum]|uniref:hypothetical protein n=1 Tax=Nocardia otitidiscaviarum TaxID=1823 RepID=UPI0004A6D9F7|nr:hypothetical protein [Nocardia otitidiscaviarum]MBF6132540.1 hypothetical protein [Nocardia otitidiscaviarum]MBF6488641.1 hypothetical protein [Nocardia otitidiscaviarum]
MKHTIFRAAAAVAVAVSAFGLAACGSGDDTGSDATTTSAAPAGEFEGSTEDEDKVTGAAPSTTEVPNLPKPTVAELNDKINKAFDPSIDAKTKISWIEDAAVDPQLVDKLVDAAKQNNVTVEITNVQDPVDGKLKADANVTIDGAPVENATVAFVAEGTEWKVDHGFACSIVKAAKLDSAACQDN